MVYGLILLDITYMIKFFYKRGGFEESSSRALKLLRRFVINTYFFVISQYIVTDRPKVVLY